MLFSCEAIVRRPYVYGRPSDRRAFGQRHLLLGNSGDKHHALGTGQLEVQECFRRVVKKLFAICSLHRITYSFLKRQLDYDVD